MLRVLGHAFIRPLICLPAPHCSLYSHALLRSFAHSILSSRKSGCLQKRVDSILFQPAVRSFPGSYRTGQRERQQGEEAATRRRGGGNKERRRQLEGEEAATGRRESGDEKERSASGDDTERKRR